MPKTYPTIYWVCPKPAAPSGGVWFIHRLAQLCQQAGLAARVARISDKNFTVWWDANPVSEIDLPLWLGENGQAGYPWVEGDTVVVPEVMWPLRDLRGARQVMFLQNYIWLDEDKRAALRVGQDIDILVCSRYLYNWCVRELGIKPIGIVTPFLDEDVWAKEYKVTGSVILFGRRNQEMSDRLYRAIGLAGYSVHLQTEPVSQRELRELFNHREFYIHSIEPEGFPMAALEAMRCGTIPVGTTGGGGNEFMFHGETAMVTAGPLLGHYADPQIFVDRVLGLLEALRANADLRSHLWINGESWSRRYTAVATRTQLVKIFGPK